MSSLSPQQASKIRRLARPNDPSPGEDAGELNVVPYLDILMNILMFVLATVAVTFVASADVKAPRANPILEGATKGLQLTVMVTEQGIAVKTSGGNLAPGCRELGPGFAVARTEGGYDLGALTDCARAIKTASPDFATEDHVTLTANPGVDYQTVVAVMDALRGDRASALFPEVAFAVAR